jgi:hypothetical protein
VRSAIMHLMTTVDPPELPACVRCGRPVRRNRDNYEVFERMHWACFHYEFEHAIGVGDPDEACRDPQCPARAFDDRPPPSWLEQLPKP